MEVNLHGDAALTLRALLPHLKKRDEHPWREEVERNVAAWWETLRGRAMQPAEPVNPQRVFWELSPRLPDGCILTADAGTAAVWLARDLKLRRGMMASLSGGLATMGSGVPYALAAKLAYPDRAVIALVGDGAMQMNGNSELLTVARMWRAWKDPRWIVLVLNNRDLNFVTWEMRLSAGNPDFDASQEIPDFPYARYGEMLGLKGIRVDRPEQIGPAWDEALAADRPVVLEACVDPNVPVLPPILTRTQAKAFKKALAQDDPRVAAQVARDAREGGVRRE
jgi:pyruvate dehydrogenase (quinone)